MERLESKVRSLPEIQESEPLVTLTCEDWTLPQAARFIADQADISIVVQDNLDAKKVTLDVKDQPVSLLLQTIAKRAGVSSNKTGSVYFLGTLGREDRGVLVRRAPKLTGEELRSTISSFLSENGTVSTFENGVVVIGDRVDVLGRVTDMLDDLEAVESKTWVVQYHVVSFTERAYRDFGFDVVPVGRVGAAFNATAAGSSGSAFADASLTAILRAAGESSDVSILAEPVVVIEDGQEGQVNILERRPFENAVTTFEEGIQRETVAVEFLELGIRVSSEVREGTRGRVVLKSVVSLSEQTAQVSGIPVVQEQSVENTAVVRNDVVSLVGAMVRRRSSSGLPSLFSAGRTRSELDEVVQVWCRVYAVE